MKTRDRVILAGILFLVSGCSKVFNPYESEFMCPDVPVGKCATMDEAYQESLNNENEFILRSPKCKDGKCEDKDDQKDSSKEKKQDLGYDYKQRLYETYAKLINSEKTPLLVPPQTVRTLIIYYPDDDGKMLFGQRFIYFMVGQPKFILDQE